MDWHKIMGLTAASLTTLAFLPQVIKTYRSRQVRDLALTTTLMLTVGTILWFSYGVVKNDLPLMAANAVTLMLVAALLMMKLLWRRR